MITTPSRAVPNLSLAESRALARNCGVRGRTVSGRVRRALATRPAGLEPATPGLGNRCWPRPMALKRPSRHKRPTNDRLVTGYSPTVEGAFFGASRMARPFLTDRTFDSWWSALEAGGGRCGGGGGVVKDAQEHGIRRWAARQRARAIDEPRNPPRSTRPAKSSRTDRVGRRRGVWKITGVDQSADQTGSTGPGSWTNSRSLT